MLYLLLRLIGIAVLWRFTRSRESSASNLTRRLYALPWRGKVRLMKSLVQDATIPLWARAIFAVPALYVVLPIDLVPDFLPFIGRLDDAFVFMLALDLVTRVVPDSIIEAHVNRAMEQERPGLSF